jgi:hypothetical protein
MGAMLNPRAGALAALVMAVACRGGDHRYPPDVADRYLASCTAKVPAGQEQQRDAFAAYCRCTLDRIQETYSLAEFNALEVRMKNEGRVPDELLPIATECREKAGVTGSSGGRAPRTPSAG